MISLYQSLNRQVAWVEGRHLFRQKGIDLWKNKSQNRLLAASKPSSETRAPDSSTLNPERPETRRLRIDPGHARRERKDLILPSGQDVEQRLAALSENCEEFVEQVASVGLAGFLYGLT